MPDSGRWGNQHSPQQGLLPRIARHDEEYRSDRVGDGVRAAGLGTDVDPIGLALRQNGPVGNSDKLVAQPARFVDSDSIG